MLYPDKAFWRRRGLSGNSPWTCGPYTLQWADDYPMRGPKAAFTFVDYAHKLISLRHTGWYTDNYQSELVRGAVYQLTSNVGPHRLPGYLAGFGDPCNGEEYGVCFERCVYDTPEEAARHANRIAEVYAEKEREYQEAWDAAQRCRDLDTRITAIRHEASKVLAEARPHRKTGSAGALCAFLKDGVTRLLRERDRAIAKRRKLVAEYGHHDGFEYPA